MRSINFLVESGQAYPDFPKIAGKGPQVPRGAFSAENTKVIKNEKLKHFSCLAG